MGNWECEICGESFDYFDNWFWHLECEHDIYNEK